MEGRGALYSLEGVGLACVPDADHPRFAGDDRQAIIWALISACEEVRCVAILGCPPNVDDIEQVRAPSDSRAAAAFLPAIHVPWRDEASQIAVTPVGHVAGAIARNDLRHGVHVPPAGLDLRGLYSNSATTGGVAHQVTDAETDLLIRRGVNPLRINTAGAVVLASAQTTAVDETWRPLQVVRTMFMIERAVTIGTRWTTFSPNTEETWAEIRAQIEEYLTTLWRRGVLSGRSAEEAFLVRCDATTMTQHDIDAGRIHILVGLAFADNRLRAPGLIELRAQALGGDGNLRTYSVPDH
jgi:phage tail sheath protein FI